MKIKQTTEHEIKFTVEAFWSEEGGMGQVDFGGEVSELAGAVHLIDLARAQFPKTNWVIVGRVVTKVA